MKEDARPGPLAPLLRRLLPVLDWLPAYRRAWLLPDVLAGLAVWAVMVPEGMAYAGIVGVPPIMGLYTIVPPLIAYALLGTSRLLVVGPDTATGLISALTVGVLAAQGTPPFNWLTSTLAILIGVFFLLFGLLRLGWVASFIPTPVMRGFIEGLVCVTIIGQVPHLLGIGGASGNFFDKLWSVRRHLPDVSVAPMLTGLLSLLAMQLLRQLAPRIPALSPSPATPLIVEIPVDIHAQCRVLKVPTLRGAVGHGFIIPASVRSLVCCRRSRSCTRHAAPHGSNRTAVTRA
jgi:MFS superfamily sulfate permease-like transporter